MILHSRFYDSRATIALLGVPCLSALHYIVISRSGIRLLELSYRVAVVKELLPDLEIIPVGDEDLFAKSLSALIPPGSRLGLVGEVPFNIVAACGCLETACDVTHLLDEVSLIKSAGEQDQISWLQGELAKAIEASLAEARIGMTEAELGRILKGKLNPLGDFLAFPMTVISGQRLRDSTVGPPTDRTFRAGDPVLIDAGVVKNGLYSDCTRMVFLGESYEAECYHNLTRALLNTITSITQGSTPRTILNSLQANCHEFTLPVHTLVLPDLGHGIGFSLHENPFFYRDSTANFAIPGGSCFTLEPELKVNEVMIRVEELIVLRADSQGNW